MALVRLGNIALSEAKILQSALSQQGVELVLDHNDHTCKRGCTVTVEILVEEVSIPLVQETLKRQFTQLSQGVDVNWELLNQVYDPAAPEAVCPACGSRFSTGLQECPECGLCF
jgi:rRNA maturation endonuclease Nob1